MNYGRIIKTDIANGVGVRVSLFVSGCRNHCKGCFNPETWDFHYGNEYTEDINNCILEYLRPDYIDGLSILGGDPMEPENIDVVTKLCSLVKKQTGKSIWIYSGYFYENIKDYPIMNYVDILVDGPFIEGQKDINLKFRGSRNQRIIDVKESKKHNKLIILKI